MAQPPAQQAEDDSRVDATFRNGSMTVVGVLTAFSLGFLTQWADNPLPWSVWDAIAILPMVIGSALELWALTRLLRPESLAVSAYRKAIRGFLWGLGLVMLGIVFAVASDAVRAVQASA